jgi:hypothetical protein
MDILHAYKEEYGEEPAFEPRLALWQHDLETFTAGWNAVDKIEIAKRMYKEWQDDCYKRKDHMLDFPHWLAKLGVQEELLEIEKDVLHQQEGLVEGR